MAAAVVPAAGSSRRMGRPKLLLPFGESTVIGSLIEALRLGGVARILLVLAPGDTSLQAWAARQELETTLNPAPERGMLSSILAGLRVLTPEHAGQEWQPLLVSPADLPAIRPQTIRLLLESYHAAAEPLVVPSYRGERGHPLLMAPHVVSEIENLEPDVGLRQLLDRYAVGEIPVTDPGVVRDVDTPEAYECLRRDVD